MTGGEIAILIGMAVIGLVGLWLAWRIIIWCAHVLIRIDDAMFRRRKRRPVTGVAVFSDEEHRAGGGLLEVAFAYRDGDGRETDRTVAVDTLVRSGNGRVIYAEGHDEMRGDRRRFRIDRMRGAVIKPTGELLETPRDWRLAGIEAGIL